MKSFLRKPLISNKRLTLTLLISFFLTYMGQAFALPMVCDMSSGEVSSSEAVSAVSPCHRVQADQGMLKAAETSDLNMLMDCCDQGDASFTHDCACPDGSCAASLTFTLNVSTSFLAFSEQALYFSTTRFLSQIESALFRPPIA